MPWRPRTPVFARPSPRSAQSPTDALKSGSADEIEGALRSVVKVLGEIEAQVTRMVALAAVYATRSPDEPV